MNYLELINQYWDLREQGILLGSEGEYYLFLLHKCNRLAWKNPFNLSNQLCCGYLGIQEKSLIKYRNKLKQVGLIDFKSGTKGNNTEYRIHFPNTCKKYSESGSLSGSQVGSESGSLSGEKPPDNIKQKQIIVDDDTASAIQIGNEKFSEEKICALFEVDVGLQMNWKQKGLVAEKFSLGIKLWYWQNVGEKYLDLPKARKHFLFWMPNFYKAEQKIKKEKDGESFKTSQHTNGKSAGAKSQGAYGILNDLAEEWGINGG